MIDFDPSMFEDWDYPEPQRIQYLNSAHLANAQRFYSAAPARGYIGDVDENMLPHGKGKLIEIENPTVLHVRIYIGEFEHGKRCGKGIEYRPFEHRLECGIWKDDKMESYQYRYEGDVRMLLHDDNIIDRERPSLRNIYGFCREGEGTAHINNNGSCLKVEQWIGTWRDDKIAYGRIVDRNDKIRYEGRFIDGKPDIVDYNAKPDLRIG